MSEKTSMFELLNERLSEEEIIKITTSYDNKFNELEEENAKLNNIINNIKTELEILLQSEDFELIIMQLRNIVFRLKGVDKE